MMSENFPSSNPFRRKGPVATAPVRADTFPTSQVNEKPLPPIDTSSTEQGFQIQSHSKVVKKVRVQSPPPLSPDGDSIYRKPPTPIPRGPGDLESEPDPFDETSSSDTSEASEALGDTATAPTSSNVPPNPFQKTLATLERTEVEIHTSTAVTKEAGPGAGRASLDVDAFKRLLLTGSATVATSTAPNPAIAHLGHLGLNDGSSTDASSISRQSIFEPVQENHPESPRTSHEVSDPDEERRRLAPDASGSHTDKKKPPPPSSRHGKLIKLELRDDTTAVTSDPTAPQRSSQVSLASPVSSNFHRSPTDINKPLPPAPARASHDSDRESVFDKEAAGKVPEPPSPPLSATKKAPPVPPLTRRHTGQLNSDPKLVRSTSGKLASSPEEGTSTPASLDNPGTPKAIPPPPPSRRPASIRNSSYQALSGITSPAIEESDRPLVTSPAPMPPPARKSSQRSSNRPPSVHSMDMSTTKRYSGAPPPPPPSRQRASSRNSTDTPTFSPSQSTRQSAEYIRRSIDSTRRESMSQTPQSESSDSHKTHDILADLSALQREVDALRDQYKKSAT